MADGATKRGLPQLTDSLVKELTTGVPGFEVPKPQKIDKMYQLLYASGTSIAKDFRRWALEAAREAALALHAGRRH